MAEALYDDGLIEDAAEALRSAESLSPPAALRARLDELKSEIGD